MSRKYFATCMFVATIVAASHCRYVASAQEPQSAGSIKYVNGLNEALTVWFQPSGSPTYLKPPVAIGPKATVVSPVSTRHSGKRYIVVRDEGNRDTHVGWVDIEAIAKSKTPTMLIDGLRVTKNVEETYTVEVPYTETRTGPDGRPYTVTLTRREQRTRAVSVTELANVNLKVAVEGKWVDVPVSSSIDK